MGIVMIDTVRVIIFALVLLRAVDAASVFNATRSIPTVIIPGSSVNNVCPSQEQLRSTRQLLSNKVRSMLSSRYVNIEECGDGFWYKLVGIDMSDQRSQCPTGWVEETIGGVRACGRGTVHGGCKSAQLPSDREYTKVCGRAIGYQYGHTDAFAGNGGRTINGVYVDGLSITYGSPRKHLWTFASAVREGPSSYTGSNCPCSSYPGYGPPRFIGNNWYCESGNPNPTTPSNLLSRDPLWDGENCEGSCCSNGKSPPWFSVNLSNPSTEIIEGRICANEHSDYNEDVFIEVFELYIQ